MATTLENLSMWLWKNPEGLHITITTNYGKPTEKRRFFNLGKQTLRSWRAYNLHQPQPLQDYFGKFKQENRNIKDYQGDYWISKMVENTGKRGRLVCQGALILTDDAQFTLRLGDRDFDGIFDDSQLSERQRNSKKGQCLGVYRWDDDTDLVDYGSAW